MEKDTKIIVIVCSSVVLTVGVGIFIYKKIQNQSAAQTLLAERQKMVSAAKLNSNPSKQVLCESSVLKNLPNYAG